MSFSPDNLVSLIASFAALLASIVAAVISVYNQRFIKEKWWDRKLDAYQTIIEALAKVHDYYDTILEIETLNIKLSDQRKEKFEKDFIEGLDIVRKSAYTGSFLISEKAEEILREFLKENFDIPPNDYMSQYDFQYSKSKLAIEKLRKEARKDLRTKRF